MQGGAFQVCEKLADIIGRELLRLGEPIVSINQVGSLLIVSLLDKSYYCTVSIWRGII